MDRRTHPILKFNSKKKTSKLHSLYNWVIQFTYLQDGMGPVVIVLVSHKCLFLSNCIRFYSKIIIASVYALCLSSKKYLWLNVSNGKERILKLGQFFTFLRTLNLNTI